MRHRPIGIGIQGLADVFMKLRIPFDSEEATKLNRDIFEAIYFGALTASCSIAEKEGPYQTYKGSPMSQGKLQFDLWKEFGDDAKDDLEVTDDRFNWTELRAKIAKFGVRNSLLLAPMP